MSPFSYLNVFDALNRNGCMRGTTRLRLWMSYPTVMVELLLQYPTLQPNRTRPRADSRCRISELSRSNNRCRAVPRSSARILSTGIEAMSKSDRSEWSDASPHCLVDRRVSQPAQTRSCPSTWRRFIKSIRKAWEQTSIYGTTSSPKRTVLPCSKLYISRISCINA
jgi:hypothetical protein